MNWSNHNCLAINWTKTFVMFITDKKNICIPESVLLNNVNIKTVSSFKLLGVYIDSNLTFKENVSNTSSKVYACLFSLKSKFFLSIETKLQFFKTFLLPHFDYCISLSIYYNIELRQQLVKLYKFCLRKLLNIKFHNDNYDKFNTQEINNMLKQYNLFSFEYRLNK